jgi:hypothetical protein
MEWLNNDNTSSTIARRREKARKIVYEGGAIGQKKIESFRACHRFPHSPKYSSSTAAAEIREFQLFHLKTGIVK